MPTTFPRLTNFEIVVHGLADGIAIYVLLAPLWPTRPPADSIEASLAFLVILLSALIMTRRFRPGIRGLRFFELGLSGLVAALGAIGAAASLLLLVSGAMYKGNSPDAGGMAIMAGFFVYPMGALLVLPFAMNASRLSPQLRRRIRWLGFVLAILPVFLLLGLGLLRHLLPRWF